MKYLILLVLLLFANPAFAVTVEVTQLPAGCEKSLLHKCEAWLFTYHYKDTRTSTLKDPEGRSLHKMESKTGDVTYSYSVYNRPRNGEPWAPTLEAAGKKADQKANEYGIK